MASWQGIQRGKFLHRKSHPVMYILDSFAVGALITRVKSHWWLLWLHQIAPVPRIACALHSSECSLARDGHWYTPAICLLKRVWSCLVIQFCTFLDMKSGGRKGLEDKGLAKHPQGLQRLRVIYHCSGVLQSVEVAVKESDGLRRMAGCRISLCWN